MLRPEKAGVCCSDRLRCVPTIKISASAAASSQSPSKRLAKAGYPTVILVGDEPYYGPLGFKRVPYGQIRPCRGQSISAGCLAHEIAPGAIGAFAGELHHADIHRARERAEQPDAA